LNKIHLSYKKYFPLISEQVKSEVGLNAPAEKACLNGVHIIAAFRVQENSRVMESSSFRSFMDLLVDEFKMSKLGEIYHDFENGGFTGVICLGDSHLSIHTRPELNNITFDVFLSNYLKDGQATAQALYHSVQHFFNATVTFEQFVLR
jgi:S-adenosylmethionine decarboxylase